MTWVVRILTFQYGLPVFLLWLAFKYIPKGLGAKRKHTAPAHAYLEWEQY